MAKEREKGEGREEEERVVGVEVAGVWRKSGDPKRRVTRCKTSVNPYFSPLISRLAMEAVSRCYGRRDRDTGQFGMDSSTSSI